MSNSVKVDVVVVGGGGSGLAAAVSAAERGVKVALIERRDALGGTTAMSVGSFAASGTRLQRRARVQDSLDDFVEDMARIVPGRADNDAPRLRALLAAEAGPTVTWLEGLGVPFAGPFPEPGQRAPRMHNVVPGPRMYIARLRRAALRLGVPIHLGTSLTEVLRDDDGHVIGVRAVKAGKPFELLAARGVVLATGDFSANATLKDRWFGDSAAKAAVTNEDSLGHGHEIAEQMGAELRNMDGVLGPALRVDPPERATLISRFPTWRWLAKLAAEVVTRAPSRALRPLLKSLLVTHMALSGRLFTEGAILVNENGDRFCDERESTMALAGQPGSRGFIVLDERIAGLFSELPNFISTVPSVAYAFFDDYRKARPDLVHSGQTVADLAGRIAVTESRLQASVESADVDFATPLYALGPVRLMLTVTEGGAAVDDQCRVLDTAGHPIGGLFAVGSIGQGGMHLAGHGFHIGWAMTSGRIAGMSVARQIPRGGWPF